MTPLPDIRKIVLLNAPIQKVWDAVATSKGLEAWWMPNTFEPILGHEFVLHTGQFGDSPCKVTVVEPPHHLVFTWGKDWSLAFELRETGGKTELTLIHSGWDSDAVTEFGQPHPQIRGFMESGWGDLARLRGFVEGQ
jgi:uncharacterized protein YndB with AHSA1/START domain